MRDFIKDAYIDTRNDFKEQADERINDGGSYAIAYAIMLLAQEFREFRQELIFGTNADPKGVLEQMVMEVRDGLANLASAMQKVD